MRRERPIALVLVLLATLAGAALIGRHDASLDASTDVNLFAQAGSLMLSTHWTQTFALPAVQAGPLELAVVAIARHFGGGYAGFAVALDVACTAAMLFAALKFVPRRAAAFALFGALLFAFHLPGAPFTDHPAEPLVAVLWLFAARDARRGRLLAAGALVGAAGCFELWGVLGVAIFALAPGFDRRRLIPAVAVAAAIPALALAPFALAGPFHMFDMRWTIGNGLPRAIFGEGRLFTWWMRVAEGVAIVAVATACARLLRRLPESVWIVPAAVALLRIPLDPLAYGYYWDAALLPLAIGTAALLAQPRTLHRRVTAQVSAHSST
jgi:hypothetical protein